MVLQICQRASPVPRASGEYRHLDAQSNRPNTTQKACPLRLTPPPGGLVYSKGALSLYEVDGAEHKLYAQNLSLFAKLFLDTKSVFYDVTTFLYYLLVLEDPTPSIQSTHLGTEEAGERRGQIVGFFSKEKMSWDNNNLACICIFPPWQKQGHGQVLMAASYELGRHEGRLGGPEKRRSILRACHPMQHPTGF